MGSVVEIIEGVYCIGGPDITDPRDCQVYLISAGERLALIDAGVGPSYDLLVANIRRLGFDPVKLALLVLTHAHIDHVGAASRFKEDYGPAIVAHRLDAQHLKEGDEEFTASNWYGLPPPVVRVDREILGEREEITLGGEVLVCLHTPGHTPGSISVYFDRGGLRVLFGQDIHGPFSPAFGSDIVLWERSMEKLLGLEADILCEGHFGVIKGKEAVENYIRNYLKLYS